MHRGMSKDFEFNTTPTHSDRDDYKVSFGESIDKEPRKFSTNPATPCQG